MATFTQLGTAYEEPDNGAVFVKFLGGCVVAAGAVLTEAANTANHANRIVWAKGILSQDQQAVYAKVRAVKNYALATDANVQFSPDGVTDGDVATAIQNALAVLATGS